MIKNNRFTALRIILATGLVLGIAACSGSSFDLTKKSEDVQRQDRLTNLHATAKGHGWQGDAVQAFKSYQDILQEDWRDKAAIAASVRIVANERRRFMDEVAAGDTDAAARTVENMQQMRAAAAVPEVQRALQGLVHEERLLATLPPGQRPATPTKRQMAAMEKPTQPLPQPQREIPGRPQGMPANQPESMEKPATPPMTAEPRQTAAMAPQPAPQPATKTPRASHAAPGRVFRDCDQCPEMVVIQPGSFSMGGADAAATANEKPVHPVSIRYRFAVGRYAVTFAEWDACVAEGGCGGYAPRDNGWGRGNRPVFNVSWDDAQSYLAWLRQKTGRDYRLLTETEWEFAARAGTETAYWWGDDIGRGNANCAGCGGEWDNVSTAPSGRFGANPWGLRDISGNIWEWVEDCWHATYQGAPSNGSAWTTGDSCERRVLRGGAWYVGPREARSAYRTRFRAGFRYNYFGFRVARPVE
ncbi:MAG: SUMF1/EgtB/PvdO family nonheme iron enzyme [Magnetospiraceae bacterium]